MRYWKQCISLLFAACFCSIAFAQDNTIETDQLSLSAAADGTITIVDKQSSITWTQAKLIATEDSNTSGTIGAKSIPSIQSVAKEGDAIVLKAQWEVPLTIRWTVTEAGEAQVEISTPEADKKLVDDPSGADAGPALAYPAPFYTSIADYAIVPEDEGLMYSTKEIDPEHDKYRWQLQRVDSSKYLHLSMPWTGLTDLDKGLMTKIDSYDYSTYRLMRCKTADGERALPMAQWLHRRGTFGEEPRKLRFCPIAKGGYVAMCKQFRGEVQKMGLFKSLKEKARERPVLEKMLGAMNMWCFTNTKDEKTWTPFTAEDVQKIYDMGFEKLALQTFANTRPDFDAGFTPEAVKKAHELGYIIGMYHLYSWTYTTGKDDAPEKYENAVHDANGKPRIAGSQWGGHYKTCPDRLDEVLGAVAAPEAEYGLDTFFSDCTTAGSTPHDCYHPDHPVTRAEAFTKTSEGLKAVTDKGMIVGAERGFWWATPGADYFEGIETIFQYFVHYTGKHRGPMLKDAPDYEKYHVNVNYGAHNRLPLFQLVYHDSVICNRRWEDHHSRDEDLWRKNDLLCILYGLQPIVRFDVVAGPHILNESFEPYRERYLQTYRDVCSWHEKIGFEEMVDHKLLDKKRLVQESRFSNGKAVVVNFSSEPWKDERGFTVEPMGFKEL